MISIVLVSVAQCAQLFAIPQIVPCQAALSMGFSSQEYGSGLPFPLPEDLPDPGIEPRSPVLQADSLPFELQGRPWMSSIGVVLISVPTACI